MGNGKTKRKTPTEEYSVAEDKKSEKKNKCREREKGESTKMETNTSGDDLFVDQLLNLDNDDDDDDIVHHLEPAPAPPLPAKQKHYDTVSPLQDDSLLSVPEQQADLEWLSYFVEDSFSHFTTPCPPSFLNPNPNPNPKRARTGGRVWSAQQTTTNKLTSSAGSGSLSLRRCSHCGVQKTPQWRGGPQGPKTLCNACGVRYKSGRLLPEYRPACSPTFSSELHSNSHRKVLEMRKNKHIRLRDSGHPLSTSNTSLLS